MYAVSTGVFFVSHLLLKIMLQAEPMNHFVSHVKLMNAYYEWPKTRSEYNIFFKEVFRMPEFMPELVKK